MTLPDFYFEKQLSAKGHKLIAGVDEVVPIGAPQVALDVTPGAAPKHTVRAR